MEVEEAQEQDPLLGVRHGAGSRSNLESSEMVAGAGGSSKVQVAAALTAVATLVAVSLYVLGQGGGDFSISNLSEVGGSMCMATSAWVFNQ